MIVLHVFRDSERGAGGWVGQTWQFQCDVIIEQHVKVNRSGIEYTFFYKKPVCKQPSTRQPKTSETSRTTEKELSKIVTWFNEKQYQNNVKMTLL